MRVIASVIGARKTPEDILDQMAALGRILGDHSWTLRSGGADGADTAFRRGWGQAHRGNFRIYTPDSLSLCSEDIIREAMKIAMNHYTHFSSLPHKIKYLHARNAQILLGKDLSSPSDVVICWTPKGKAIGGTGHAIRIAKRYNIPVINMGKDNWVRNYHKLLLELQHKQAMELINEK